MPKTNCILYYQGPVNNTVLTEQRMQGLHQQGISLKLEKKLFMVLVELGQNITKYSIERSKKTNCGIGELSIFRDEHVFTFKAKNLAKRAAAIQVINRCKQLNSLDKNMLRTLRREIMSMPFNPNHIGAKLGLIQVCLYADSPLETEFIPQSNPETGFLSISAQVNLL